MSTPIQNFFKATLSQDWSIGTGTFYVTTKPTVSSGWLVISPSNDSLREIVKFTSTGTDSNGDYIVVSERGVDSTDEQTHTQGEKIRMNLSKEYWEEMQNDINTIVAAGAANASTTQNGLVEIATDAEVSAGTETGGTGAILAVTPKTLKDNVPALFETKKTIYTTSTTWTKPAGLKYIDVEMWGGGGGGARGDDNSNENGGGGGGGAYNHKRFLASEVGSTESVTIGAGGVAGVSGDGGVGGNTSFGTLLYAYGGGQGRITASGSIIGAGGGGQLSAGSSGGTETGTKTAGSPGFPIVGDGIDVLSTITMYWQSGTFGGGAGGSKGKVNGGSSFHGGGGGGYGTGTGGFSVNGGNGGNGGNGVVSSVAGSIPGGGGGGGNQSGNAAGAAGARGEVRITEYYI